VSKTYRDKKRWKKHNDAETKEWHYAKSHGSDIKGCDKYDRSYLTGKYNQATIARRQFRRQVKLATGTIEKSADAIEAAEEVIIPDAISRDWAL